MKYRYFIALVLIAIILPLINCEPKKVGGPYYFAGWRGKSMRPMRLSDPLDAETAIKGGSYYEAYYDDKGRLVNVKRFIYGKKEFEIRYRYKNGKCFIE